MTDWYCRPNALHSTLRDGKSYETAWGGHAEVVYAQMAVTDRLIFCGAHTYSANIVTGKAGSSSTARFTYSGAYPNDPGKLTFTAGFPVINKNNISIEDLEISGAGVCAYVQSVANVSFRRNWFRDGSNGIQFEIGAGSSQTGTLIDDNDFEGIDGTGAEAAIQWYAASAVSASLADITITNNRFHNCKTSTQVIHIRNTSAATALISGTNTIRFNKFMNIAGYPLRIGNDNGVLNSFGTWIIDDNEIYDAAASGANLGGVGLNGLVLSYQRNKLRNVAGAAGGCNPGYCSGIVADNDMDTLITTGIDGCGVLVDIGCANLTVARNKVRNALGTASVNSGAAVMVLAATGITVEDNLGENCKHALYIGAAGAGQDATIRRHNVRGVTGFGVYLEATAAPANIKLTDSVFAGTGGFVSNAGSAWAGESRNTLYMSGANVNHTEHATDIRP